MNFTIFGIVLFSLFIVVNIAFVVFGLIKTHKLNKELEEYKKYCELLSGKQYISFNKEVDYKNLKQSADYLTYNSKVCGKNRELTEQEFATMKQDYMFYTYPRTYLIKEKLEKKL